jgi:hypothetical protein
MSKDIHVKLMPRYSAISPLAPNGSVEKYSRNVIIVIPWRLVYINFELKETPRFTRECIVFVFNCVLECLHVDTTVKENQMDKQLPYTTKSGLQIGCNYTPPQRNYMSADAELLQMALLDIEPEFSQRRIAGWVAYALFLVALYAVLIVWEV